MRVRLNDVGRGRARETRAREGGQLGCACFRLFFRLSASRRSGSEPIPISSAVLYSVVALSTCISTL